MGNANQDEKIQKHIKIISWTLIVASSLVLLSSLLLLKGYSNMITLRIQTQKFNPPVQINFTLYFVLNAIKLLLSIIIFASSTFVLKYSELGRKTLIYGLTISIIYLLISPIVNYFYFPMQDMVILKGMEKEMMNMSKSSHLIFSYFWSFVEIAFFVYVIKRLNKKETIEIFNL